MLRLRSRRTVRSALAGSLLVAVGGLTTAGATETVVKPIIFPVDGPVTYTDTFGAPRPGGRTHEGEDLMGTKMQLELAAVDGTVSRITFDNALGNSLVITAADGWTYHYIHVNNDTPGTDDGHATRDQAFPPSIQLGTTVTKGQVVAYMGDSGNAEATGPHLHFEIRRPAVAGTYTGVAINPFASLQQATVFVMSPHWELRRTATAGAAQDVFNFGLQVGDRALLCDWDGDGLAEPVIYRSGQWHLRNGVTESGTARMITFGTAADTPLCGNVDGDAGDEPLLFRAGTWTARAGFETTDAVAFTVKYGLQTGDQPVVGDWDGSGAEDLAVLRHGVWYIRSNGVPGGITIATFTYGTLAGDRPIAADWDGNGTDDAGIYRGSQFHMRTSAAPGGYTRSMVSFGSAPGQPVVGRWLTGTMPGIGIFRSTSA